MGNESKWWTWGMEGYDRELNLSIYTYSTYEVWNSTSQSIFTIENFTRLFSDDFLTSTTIQTSTTLTHNFIITVVVATILFIIILITIIGNFFVMSAILLERHLRQNVANYLIFSLAVADLFVACFVMPLGALYEVSHKWKLGAVLCDLWTSIDVLSCTASILHLVAIGVDRWLAVTSIDYMHQRTGKRIGMMIFIVWLVSIFICIAPLFGWEDADRETRIVNNHTCLINQNADYQVFATISSFYLPSFVILILYWKIYQVARKRIRRRPGKTLHQGHLKSNDDSSKTIETGHAVGDALAQAQVSGGIAAAVVAVIGRPLPTVS
ncbi:5-hydroxytryptamine receptor-like, partial [Chelonus insularis]|uniref:5-hydroxytryptamine receptor-like n=1 Tax=Chelonus insularis TaxID=460826 RepID=UPI00158C3293